MICFDQVTYHYPNGAPVLRDVSFEVMPGEFLLVIGASGAGKSTLLRMVNGLVPHFYGGAIAGQIRVGGRDPVAVGPRGMSDLVGFVFQDPESQFVTDRVEDELAFAMENHNLPQTTMQRRVEEVLSQLTIGHLRQRAVNTLSGGERQRVAIGSVLTLQPQILVLDEPTSQLDPQAAEEVLTVLQKLNEDLGLTIVLSEHRLERVAQYTDRICFLSGDGRAPLIGEPRSVLAQVDLAPPLVRLGKAMNWQPLPLTLKEARFFLNEARVLPKKDPSSMVPATAPATVSVPSDGSASNLVALSVRGLSFAYDGKTALYDISLQVAGGEFVALMGRNGAGKSTLLKNIMGLLKPSDGSVCIVGRDTKGLPVEDIARDAGLVPQNPARLLFAETVEGELAFTRKGHGLVGGEPKKLLDDLGLTRYRHTYPRDLSVGEGQRTALASILAAEPKLLLLDEPTRGLDYASKEALIQILLGLRRQGVSILMATHDVELVARCADRVVLLSDGRIAVDGPVREVMTDSLVFASQINKLYRDPRFLTVADVLAAQE